MRHIRLIPLALSTIPLTLFGTQMDTEGPAHAGQAQGFKEETAPGRGPSGAKTRANPLPQQATQALLDVLSYRPPTSKTRHVTGTIRRHETSSFNPTLCENLEEARARQTRCPQRSRF